MDYKELEVWQKAHNNALKVYEISSKFPKEEGYGLTSQIRRAAASIPMNIAEGKGSIYIKEYIRFLGVARASASELEYQLLLSRDLGYINEEEYNYLYNENRRVLKMLNSLIKVLKNRFYRYR